MKGRSEEEEKEEVERLHGQGARGRCLDGNQAYHKQEVEVCGWRPQLLCLAAVLLLLNQSRVTRTTNSFGVDL